LHVSRVLGKRIDHSKRTSKERISKAWTAILLGRLEPVNIPEGSLNATPENLGKKRVAQKKKDPRNKSEIKTKEGGLLPGRNGVHGG